MKENLPNLVKEIDQEAQRVSIMMDARRPTPRHIVIKRPKAKSVIWNIRKQNTPNQKNKKKKESKKMRIV